MAEIRPFRGIRYNLSAVRDMTKVICPPYDIISLSQEESLRQRSPFNAVRLELREMEPGEPAGDRYVQAANLFRKWLEEGTLVREESPAMYVTEEEFTYDSRTLRRRGLLAVVRLVEFAKGIVMPHEFTTPGPKADRLALMKAARANFSPVMSLYGDPDRTIGRLLDKGRQEAPLLSARPEGLPALELRKINDPELLSNICEAFSALRLFLADGHHRYETALRFRDELEDSENALSHGAAARYVMMTLIAMDDPGLLVLPYHRLFGGLRETDLASLERGLERVFSVAAVAVPSTSTEETVRTIQGHLASRSPDDVVIAVLGLTPGEVRFLTLRESYRPSTDGPPLQKCDLWILHEMAIRPALGAEVERATISFVHDAVKAVESVRSGEKQVAFLLRSLPLRLLEEVVRKGGRLPPKSTYFSPKLLTGLVFNSLVGEL